MGKKKKEKVAKVLSSTVIVKAPKKKKTEKEKKLEKLQAIATAFPHQPSFVVIGIDQGLNSTGLSLLKVDGEKGPTLLTYQSIKCKDKWSDGFKVKHMETNLSTFLSEHATIVDMVCIEKLYIDFGARLKTGVLKTAYISGVIYKLAEELGLPVIEVPSKKMKEATTSKGAADKKEVIEAVKDHFPQLRSEKVSDHEADAIGFALTGPSIIWGAHEMLKKEHQASLKKEEQRLKKEAELQAKEERRIAREKAKEEREKAKENKRKETEALRYARSAVLPKQVVKKVDHSKELVAVGS